MNHSNSRIGRRVQIGGMVDGGGARRETREAHLPHQIILYAIFGAKWRAKEGAH